MSINRWIESSELKSFKTPGGHRRILRKDLLEFIKKHDFPLPELSDILPLKILIVDDDKKARDLITQLLKSYNGNYEIISAEDGFDAGIKITQYNPDVVILDLLMPEIDGFKVCEQIKTNRSTSHIKIIVLTGYGCDENVTRAMNCGADRVLFKPINVEVLVREIKKVTNKIVTTHL